MTKYADIVKTNIKKIIKQKGISLYQLGLGSEVTDACLRNWYGPRNYSPTIESLEKICNYLDISMSEIFASQNDNLQTVPDDLKLITSNWKVLTKEQKALMLQLMEVLLNANK